MKGWTVDGFHNDDENDDDYDKDEDDDDDGRLELCCKQWYAVPIRDSVHNNIVFHSSQILPQRDISQHIPILQKILL